MDSTSLPAGETAFFATSDREISNPRNRRLFNWWLAARASHAMPRYSDFDPVEHPWALGFVSVVSVLDDGDYYYRLDGTNVVAYFGVEMTHRRLGDYPFPERRARIKKSFEAVKAAKAPVYVRRNIIIDDKVLNIELLLLPFSADGESVSEIMSCFAHG